MPLGEYSPPENRIVHYTSVDFSDRNSFNTPVYLVQRDTTLPIVAVSVMKDGVAYPIPAEADVNICWKKPKPDVHYVYSPCLGADPTRTIVYFEVEQQMTVTYGEVHATLEIQIGMSLAGSARLPIFVEKNPIQDEDMESSSEAKTILDYVGRAETAMTEAKQSATDSEASAFRAEAAKNGIEEALSQTESARDAAEESARKAEEAAEHPPRIQEDNDHWWIWDKEAGEYVDSGIDAGVSLTVVDAITGEPGTAAKVENIGTATDPILRFTIPVGADGKTGFSPTVEITKEGKDNIITITDENGPHTFTVRDGEASIPKNLIVGEDGDIPGEIKADADTLQGHPAEYFATKEEVTACLSEKQDTLTFDEIPTAGSENPVKSGGAYSVLQKKSGKNILANSDFRKPINQRKTISWINPNDYGIDRWRKAGASELFIVNGVGIRCDAAGAEVATGPYQLIEPEFLTEGDMYTASALFTDGELLTCSGECVHYEDWTQLSIATSIDGISFVRFISGNSGGQYYSVDLGMVNGKTVVACKLERGDMQTLAHKEGDKWVLNDPPPDHATELAKCQRYYLPVELTCALGYHARPYPLHVFIPTPSSLRADPAIIVSQYGGMHDIRTGVDCTPDISTIFGIAARSPEGITISMSGDRMQNADVGDVSWAQAKLAFDAEL